MKKQSLNGAWTLEIPGTAFGRVPAQVPGSVYHDLLCAGKIPDPFYRDNENEALKLMEHDFVYTRSFCADAALLHCGTVLLRCEGLDTLAEIMLNGSPVGRADNMHRTWEYEVGPLLQEGENRIEVRFSSPTRFIREAYAENPADGSSDAMVGFPLLRKAHCMFGWDWGPRLPDAGIWRDIALIGIERARIRDVLVLQEHAPDAVTAAFMPPRGRTCASGFPSPGSGGRPASAISRSTVCPSASKRAIGSSIPGPGKSAFAP